MTRGSLLLLALGASMVAGGCGDGAAPSASAAIATTAAASSAPPSISGSAPAPTPSASAVAEDPAKAWLPKVLVANDPHFSEWLAKAEDLRLQILVTPVDAAGNLAPSYEYRVDAEYFYPASAIKTFIAVSALRKLGELAGGEVDLGTRIVRCRDDKPGCEPPTEDEDDEQPKDEEDKKHAKLRVGEEITKLLSYSDNESYNRLYDIVGHRELNEEVAAMGFQSVRIHHKMNTPAKQSRLTLRVQLLPPAKKSFEVKKRKSELDPAPTPAARLAVGTSYSDKGKMVNEPMSFATKNYVSLRDLQAMTLSLVFPENPRAHKLGLTEAQRKHLLRAMTLKVEATKRSAEHGPLTPGILDVLPGDRVRYVAKSGRAFGFHLENAFIEDVTTHKGFFVTVTVYANEKGVLNTDDYSYDEISRPLLKSLGAILAKELLVGSAP